MGGRRRRAAAAFLVLGLPGLWLTVDQLETPLFSGGARLVGRWPWWDAGGVPTLFVVDAFTDRHFSGNPAAVCLSDSDDDAWMQAVASETNLPATAFVGGEGSRRRMRWFSPTTELELCGHGTLASAHVLWEHLGETSDQLMFSTRAGDLLVRRSHGGGAIALPVDLPGQRRPRRRSSRPSGSSRSTLPAAVSTCSSPSPTPQTLLRPGPTRSCSPRSRLVVSSSPHPAVMVSTSPRASSPLEQGSTRTRSRGRRTPRSGPTGPIGWGARSSGPGKPLPGAACFRSRWTATSFTSEVTP